MFLQSVFKEWKVVADQLAAGRQVLILRKGGLAETGGVVTLEADTFWILPTLFHQSAKGVIAELAGLVAPQPTRAGLEANPITLRHWASVTDYRWVKDLATLERLRPYHVWSDETIRERFHRWQEDGVLALIVRVHALAQPLTAAWSEQFAGCKSWLTLANALPKEPSAPVLDEPTFAFYRHKILTAWS